jgi:hypothetical protein
MEGIDSGTERRVIHCENSAWGAWPCGKIGQLKEASLRSATVVSLRPVILQSVGGSVANTASRLPKLATKDFDSGWTPRQEMA